MHGGVKVYRGAASAARAYVESDRSRVDDYYLAEGSGLAHRFGASPGGGVQDLGVLDGDGYEQWVAGHDPVTGLARGRLRQDSSAVRFVEITVNGPKTWSLAAALHPEIAAAYETSEGRDLARGVLKSEARGKKPAEVVEAAMTELAAVSALVAAKAPEAAPGFRDWLKAIAGEVAEAGTEGGFLGFGGEKVSAAEKATLDRLATALV